jgi:hypothetical protein
VVVVVVVRGGGSSSSRRRRRRRRRMGGFPVGNVSSSEVLVTAETSLRPLAVE